MRFRTSIMCGAGALSVGLLIGLSADEILVTKRLTILNDTDKTAVVAIADGQGRGLLIVYDEAGEQLFAVRNGAVAFPELRRLDAEITLHASQVRRLQKRVEALEKKDSAEGSQELQPKAKSPTPGQVFLREHLDRLLEFKDTSEFRYYGFSVGGPYHKWLEEVEAQHNNDDTAFTFMERVAVGDLLMLALEYVTSDPDDDYIKSQIAEIRQVLPP